MTLYGKKISSYREMNEYKEGQKKVLISSNCPVVPTDAIVLFNRENKVGCVLRVTRVQRGGTKNGPFFISVEVLNPEDQDITIKYFGYTGVVGIRFIGYASLSKKLRLTPRTGNRIEELIKLKD